MSSPSYCDSGSPTAIPLLVILVAQVTVVVLANRAYQILRGELKAMGAGTPGQHATDMLTLDRPDLDWVALARGLGVEGSRALDLEEFSVQLKHALAHRGPRLIELVL